MIQTRSVLLSAIAASLAGFLFGFDTIVISGADRPIQALWDTGDLFHGTFIMSMALWGTVVGALFGGIPCDRLGRKRTLFWIGLLYLVSAVGSALAPDPYVFSFSRFIGGLGVGASSVVVPVYVSEITPASDRGRLTALYQFNIVLGVLVAFLSNYLIGSSLADGAWRWMLGVEALPALVYSVFVLGVPESPRWLALRAGDEAGARRLLGQLHPTEDVDGMFAAIRASVDDASEVRFLSRRFSRPILLAFLLAFFNQLSGINFVLYYAPRIFEQAGLAAGEALGPSRRGRSSRSSPS